MPSEKPIIFSSEMVRAILDGKKTCTTRILPKELYPVRQNVTAAERHRSTNWFFNSNCSLIITKNGKHDFPGKYIVGDILYVRESVTTKIDNFPRYVADGTMVKNYCEKIWPENKVIPSIHVPKLFSRIKLSVIWMDLRRLENYICDSYITAEGFADEKSFKNYWNKLNEKRGYGWETNPWAWIIEFKVIEVG